MAGRSATHRRGVRRDTGVGEFDMERIILVLPVLAFACTRQRSTSSVSPGGYEDLSHKSESSSERRSALSEKSNGGGHSPSIPRMRLQLTAHEGQPVIRVAMCDPGDDVVNVCVHDIAIQDQDFTDSI